MSSIIFSKLWLYCGPLGIALYRTSQGNCRQVVQYDIRSVRSVCSSDASTWTTTRAGSSILFTLTILHSYYTSYSLHITDDHVIDTAQNSIYGVSNNLVYITPKHRYYINWYNCNINFIDVPRPATFISPTKSLGYYFYTR